jgi:hypothetical protein
MNEEERIVAELELLGIRYLSRHTSDRAERVRPPDALLAHPEYVKDVPARLTSSYPFHRGLASEDAPLSNLASGGCFVM